ncbi:MAG: tetratricopeptide repeat protein [Betaproteobacteria bacterium]|nr:tetratricopeptide repeat protein [Betaproteobacteria bacterium]
MSLLIDALRKAEADRQRGAGGDAAAPPEISEALALEPIDLEMAELSPADSRPAPSEAPRTTRPQQALPKAPSAARKTFSSKMPRGPSSLERWIVLIGLCLAAAGGAYIWWQTQPRSLQPTSPAIERGMLQPSITAHVPAPSVNVEAPASIAPATQAAAAAPQPMETPAPSPSAEKPARIATAGKRRTPPASLLAAADQPSVRQGALKPVNPAAAEIEAGYAAYASGDLATARAYYLSALHIDPRALDALNGLGAIAMQSNRPEEAERWFREAQRNNPADPTAQAGLASIGRDADPLSTESQLKNTLARNPDAAAVHFALGNVQARAGRWADAQQAFFRAYTLEPDNPDYQFNLAVALDHLNQTRLAAQYYRLAVEAGAHKPAHFDRDAAYRRLQALSAP